MGSKQVVVAIFPDEAQADTAAQSLKDWDKLDDDVKLNAIGVLVLDEKGKIKTQKIGRRSWGKGAGIGVVLAALTPPGLLAGALAGGVLGSLHHKGLGVDSAERDQIADALVQRPRGSRSPGRRLRGFGRLRASSPSSAVSSTC